VRSWGLGVRAARVGLGFSVDISDAWQGRSRIMYKQQTHVHKVLHSANRETIIQYRGI